MISKQFFVCKIFVWPILNFCYLAKGEKYATNLFLTKLLFWTCNFGLIFTACIVTCHWIPGYPTHIYCTEKYIVLYSVSGWWYLGNGRFLVMVKDTYNCARKRLYENNNFCTFFPGTVKNVENCSQKSGINCTILIAIGVPEPDSLDISRYELSKVEL